MPPRPTPGSPDTWGAALNAWLDVGHNADGTNNGVTSGTVTAKVLDAGGFAYNIQNAGLGATILQDGSDQAANINTVLGNIPAGAVAYWPTPTTAYGLGATVTNFKANQTHIGSGRQSCLIQRRNTTNQRMFSIITTLGLTFQDFKFDQNGANQSSNHDGLRFDQFSDNPLVERCSFINSGGFGLILFGTPLQRGLNPRVRDIDITPIGSFAGDLLTVVAEGGSTIGVRIHAGHSAACINIYESNNHPIIGSSETLSGLGAQGITFSSCHRCPGIGNAITLGANDIGIEILKETDNPTQARPVLDQVVVGTTISGVSNSIGYQINSAASNIHILGGSIDTCGVGIQTVNGPVIGLTVGDVEFLNVTSPWSFAAPITTFVKFHDCQGLNPFGLLPTVTVPGSGVDIINNNFTDAMYYVTANATTISLGFQPPPILLLTTATTGGTLVPGTYAYRVSMVDQAGGETLACTEATIVVPAGTNTNTVTVLWYQPAGATRSGSQVSYRVYGRTSGAELKMTNASITNTFTDTGSITPSGALPATNGSQRGLGLGSGAFFVPANQTIAWSGGSAPTMTAYGA